MNYLFQHRRKIEKKVVALTKLMLLFFFLLPNQKIMANEFVDLSKSFLSKLIENQKVETEVEAYAKLSMQDLISGLKTREEKLAFWINTYNGFIIYILRADPSKYDNRGQFFTGEQIHIAGQILSFDNIEHDILRDSRIKWSLGYLQKWFVPSEIRKLRMTKREPRIHFALNCGALSCPPVDVYDDNTINQQLDKNSKDYLSKITTVEGDKVSTTPLFSWFRGDFGGLKGVKKMLASYGIIKEVKGIDLKFKGYDWTIDIDNVVE